MSEEKRIFHPSVFNRIAEAFPQLDNDDKKLISAVFLEVFDSIDGGTFLEVPGYDIHGNPRMDAGFIRDYCAVCLYEGKQLPGETDKRKLDYRKINPEGFLKETLDAFFSEYEELSLKGGHFYIEPDCMNTVTIQNIPLWSVQYLMEGKDDSLSTFEKNIADVWKRNNHVSSLSYIDTKKAVVSMKPAFGLPCKCTDAVFERKPADRSRNRSFEYSR